MVPTLTDGDLVFVDPRRVDIVAGSIVAAVHPTRADLRIVKRVESVDTDRHIFLRSDNEDAVDASDSRTFGAIKPGQVIGRVTSRIAGRG